MDTETTIADLVGAARSGAPDAFATLVRRHRDASLAYARAVLRDHARAEEAVQDAFVEAHTRLESLREPAAFPGWLRRIVHKQCDRRMRRRDELPSHELVAAATAPEVRDLDHRDRWNALRRAVDGLPDHERVVVALHHLGGVPVAGIAAFLEVSVGAVKTRLSRARSRLRNTLEAPMRSPASPALPPEVSLFLAIRADARDEVRRTVATHPHLLDREESWDDEVALSGGFPLAHPRTPLMLAAGLGRLDIVDDLLDAGADPTGRCTCANAESAVWVARRFGHEPVVDRLLDAGADPEARHRSGVDLAALARWRTHRPPTAWGRDGDRLHTGIGALDLWLAPHVGDVVRLEGAAETGLMVLLGELAHAVGAAGGHTVWTSWVPHPWHAQELEEVARRGAVESLVTPVTPATRSLESPERVLPEALAQVARLAEEGDVVHVVFEQPSHAVDLLPMLPRLGPPATLTVVVRPWADATRGVPADETWSPDGWIRTSGALARRGIWPAVDPEGTGSARDEPALTRQTRERLAAGGDDAEALLRALRQPFHTATPDIGLRGESWGSDELARRLEATTAARPRSG